MATFAVLASVAPLSAGGCDTRSAPSPTTRDLPKGSNGRLERLLHVDAGDLEPTTDPLPPPGNLKMELDQFTTVDACVQQRSRLDPLIGDALEAIGYDTFLRDACRVLDAAKARDGKRCDAIDASSLRERCKATFAEITGDADACPWQISARPDRGRDAACVAIALREPRLCAAVERGPPAAICEAIAAHSTAPCNDLLPRTEQARCARDEQRWRGAIPEANSVAPPLPAAAGRLLVDGADAGAAVESDLQADIARGVVIVQQSGGLRLVIGPLSRAGPGFIAPPPHAPATLALELVVRARGSKAAAEARVERIELLLPGRPPFATPAPRSTLVVVFDKLEPVRGGEVRFTLSGEVEGEGATAHLNADVTTFVRDVVNASAIYGTKLPPLGTDGGVR